MASALARRDPKMKRLIFSFFFLTLFLNLGGRLLANHDAQPFEAGTRVIITVDKDFNNGGRLAEGASAVVLKYLPIAKAYSLRAPCEINPARWVIVSEEDLRFAKNEKEFIDGKALCRGINYTDEERKEWLERRENGERQYRERANGAMAQFLSPRWYLRGEWQKKYGPFSSLSEAERSFEKRAQEILTEMARAGEIDKMPRMQPIQVNVAMGIVEWYYKIVPGERIFDPADK